MSTPLPFGSNTIPTFVYEPFSYTISNPDSGTYTLDFTKSSGIPNGYIVNNGSNIVFSTLSNAMATGAQSFTITATSGSTVLTSSNIVNVKAGRFLDAPSGASYDGRSFTFFKNEPITAVPLVAPFAIDQPTSVPSLPPGLTYTSNDSNKYSITGTPTVTIPQSNYLFIGKANGSNLGKVVTSQFGLSVSNERVLLNLSGTSIVSGMTIGTAISNRVITAAYPPYPSGGTLRYSWSGLPDGISVTDNSGNTKTSPFTPSDASSTLILTGTPTVAAANAYRDANIISNVVSFTATRTNPLPQISNSQAISFAFGETVLFDTPPTLKFYNGVTLDQSTTFFRAQTYFAGFSAISNMTAPSGLPSGLTLTFESSSGRGYLGGTPDTTGSASYTIRAVNSNNITRDISVPIAIEADVVTFVDSPAVDVCYNFVLSRPSSLALTGYYPSGIRYSANATSRKPVTFSVSGLAGTGLSLSNVSANTVQIVGTPSTITSLTTATITASATGSPASATRDFKFAILNDDISFSQPTTAQLSFIQNRTITPIQLAATTLSERPVLSFSGSNMPTGVTVSATGLISGTPTADVSGSFTITASTGYMGESQAYNYSITPDSVLFLVNPTYVYEPLNNVSIDIDSLTYSGTSLSNFAFSGFSPTYGLSIAPSTGVISGTLISGLPPGTLYSSNTDNFTVTANSGLLSGTLPGSFTASNVVVNRSFLLADGVTGGGDPYLYTTDNTAFSNWIPATQFGGSTLTLKNTSVDSNVFLIGTGLGSYYRSPDGVNWTNISNIAGLDTANTIYQFLYDSNSSNWYAAGTSEVDYQGSILDTLTLFSSSDDGLSWTKVSTTAIPPRLSGFVTNYFTRRGVAIAVKDGTILVGGGTSVGSGYFEGNKMARSTDGGLTWDKIVSVLQDGEVAEFETSTSTWIAVGSSKYSMGTYYEYFTESANTIVWSENDGLTWTNATGAAAGDLFNVTATRVVYDGSGMWLAVGLNSFPSDSFTTIVTGLSYSVDGKEWSQIKEDELGVTFTVMTGGFGVGGMPLPEINDIWIYESYWYLYIRFNNLVDGYPNKILRHAIGGDMSTGWSTYAEDVLPFADNPDNDKYVHGFKNNYIRLGRPTTLTLTFDALPSGGPTVTSPTQRSYLFYQYVPISSITFTATGTGQIYYFVDTNTLPRGITFDPLTATLSGTSVLIGTKSFTIYVKDDIGVTSIVIETTTIIPQVIRQQTSAGAWTSLVRQYTVVNAAQNSVNGRALPATEPPLGEFMRPEPPDSVSAAGDPNCVKKC